MSVVAPVGHLLFHTPDEWVAVLDGLCEDFTTALDRAVTEATRKIEESGPGTLEALGFVAGPTLGALGLVASDQAKEEARARLAAAARSITEDLDRLRAKVFDEADGLMGDPARLKRASERLEDAKSDLDILLSAVRRSSTQVDRYWRGQAERAFASATGFQVAAVARYVEWLSTASTTLSSVAESIKLLWSALVDVLRELGTGLLRDIASAFDVGNVFSFEIGPALSTLATIIDAVADVGRLVRDAAARAETTMTTQWEVMDSSPEVPGGRWPLVDDLDLHDLSDPSRWSL
ncbi:WXG100 family type VII secretion target [Nocardioides litoris]|uniref:WXG100 family type VII secretion target n=1 Tax=Nocardioides litoris TaxID=1926648 RepID=UPI00111DADF0|nr:hypothetical protein [Nocardioides litoris]